MRYDADGETQAELQQFHVPITLLVDMENFIAHFNALESQSTTEIARLEELRRSNAIKQEVIANMKRELARYNELDQRQNEKRENFECQRKVTMENVTANLSRAETLSTELETLDLECANQLTNKDEVRMKLDGLRTQMAKIGEMEKRLRSDVHDLKQPPGAVAADLITEMRARQAVIRKEISHRMASFDLTAIVAEVQAIESQRKQRLELSKELAAKSEILSNLDADNEALASQLQELQTQFAALQEEKEKVIQQNEDNARRLNDMELEKEKLIKTSESLECELEEIRNQATIQKQKQAEIDEKISSARRALEEMNAEVLYREEALKRLKEEHESKEVQMAIELENMKNDFQQQFGMLSKQRDTYVKASEDARAEIEKWKSYGRFIVIYEERCREIAEAQEKLSKLKERHRNLLKKEEEKKKKSQQALKLETVGRDVDAKKREVEKRIGDMKAHTEKLDADIIEEERKVECLQNKIFEIDGEICLLKYQISTKAEELRKAKISFMESVQKNSAQAGDGAENSTSGKQKFKERQRQRLRGKEPTREAVNGTEQQLNRRFSMEERKSDNRIARKEKEMKNQWNNRIECIEKKNEMKKVIKEKDSNAVFQLGGEPRTRKAINAEVEGDQSSSLQHTTTLASMLADDFKRDITVNLDDSVVLEDDGGDLLGRAENVAHNKSPEPRTHTANTTIETDAAQKL
uniref:Myosin tail domain-containing protein n=1 Tax=Angiostrongylus cantonensis TaxID=6313 RepID=A0A0K0DIJ8_ANGCA